MPETRAEIRLPTRELRIDVPYYTKTPGMRMDKICPVGDPLFMVAFGPTGAIRVAPGMAPRYGENKWPWTASPVQSNLPWRKYESGKSRLWGA